jgi:glycosyltransferase involved in cell wall biosynthesis
VTVNITFIIPHKGREEFLAQTVESILSQDFDSTQFEVLIITQNKTLENKARFEQATATINIHFQPEDKTISALRNFGVKQAKGQYLAFLDADIKLSPNWLNCMLETINEKPQRVLTSASQINSVNAPPLERIRTALSNAELDCSVNFLPGRNLFIKKETFVRVKGFPEHLITCEDYYFTDQVHQLGELYYTSKANYVHLGEDKQYNEMYKKEIWRGQSNLQSIKGRKIPLREIPSFIIPPMLLILFTISLFSLIMNNAFIATSSFIFLLLPVAAYSIRLHKLTKNEVKFMYVFKFYLVYFPARAVGTIGGLFKPFTNSNTK